MGAITAFMDSYGLLGCQFGVLCSDRKPRITLKFDLAICDWMSLLRESEVLEGACSLLRILDVKTLPSGCCSFIVRIQVYIKGVK